MLHGGLSRFARLMSRHATSRPLFDSGLQVLSGARVRAWYVGVVYPIRCRVERSDAGRQSKRNPIRARQEAERG